MQAFSPGLAVASKARSVTPIGITVKSTVSTLICKRGFSLPTGTWWQWKCTASRTPSFPSPGLPRPRTPSRCCPFALANPSLQAHRTACSARSDGEANSAFDDDGLNAARQEQSDRLHRFFHAAPLPRSGSRGSLDKDEARHATRVLRLKDGDHVSLFDGEGNIVRARLMSVRKDAAVVEAVEAPRECPPPGPVWQLAVACGSLKGGRADWLVEKCAELGAQEVIPLQTERSDTVAPGRCERWRRVVAAASKQCLRTHKLELAAPARVAELLPRVRAAPLALLAAAGAPPLASLLAASPEGGQGGGGRCSEGGLLIVGPEGDFTDGELDDLIAAGARPVGLGPLRLRVETAAVGMLAAVTFSQQ